MDAHTHMYILARHPRSPIGRDPVLGDGSLSVIKPLGLGWLNTHKSFFSFSLAPARIVHPYWFCVNTSGKNGVSQVAGIRTLKSQVADTFGVFAYTRNTAMQPLDLCGCFFWGG